MPGDQPEPEPDFIATYALDAIDAGSISIRHRREEHWWRFEVAEKNGRLQLVHADHRANPKAERDIAVYGVDAYDAATREARQRGMVD